MTATDARSSAFLAYIVAQTRQNVDFLLEHNHISNADASTILARLPKASTAQNITLSPSVTPPSNHTPHRTAPPPPVAPSPTSSSPSSPVVQCRAIWAYQAQDEKDLSFQANEIITIVEENNSDWWTGSLNGRIGLFPSSYVEKIPSLPQAGHPSAYRPFGVPFQNQTFLPPPGPYVAPVNSVGLQPDPEQEKKSKFGKYGNTMAHSAAGGVGFGAGAAIGSGIINAIF